MCVCAHIPKVTTCVEVKEQHGRNREPRDQLRLSHQVSLRPWLGSCVDNLLWNLIYMLTVFQRVFFLQSPVFVWTFFCEVLFLCGWSSVESRLYIDCLPKSLVSVWIVFCGVWFFCVCANHLLWCLYLCGLSSMESHLYELSSRESCFCVDCLLWCLFLYGVSPVEPCFCVDCLLGSLISV